MTIESATTVVFGTYLKPLAHGASTVREQKKDKQPGLRLLRLLNNAAIPSYYMFAGSARHQWIPLLSIQSHLLWVARAAPLEG